MSTTNPFVIERHGDRWAIRAGEEIMALTRTRRDAQSLARRAAEALSASAPGEVRFQRRLQEPRSFIAPD